MLEKAIRRVISAAIPHQKCLWHAAEAVKNRIGWQATVRLRKKLTELKESLDSRKQSLYYAGERFVELQRELAEVRGAYEAKQKLLERFKKTTVMTENINKQFQRRFKTIEAFQSVESAFDYLNLYRNYLRFKPYTDCRGHRKHRNGRSPLQLCGATIPTTDWLVNAIRSPSITNR